MINEEKIKQGVVDYELAEELDIDEFIKAVDKSGWTIYEKAWALATSPILGQHPFIAYPLGEDFRDECKRQAEHACGDFVRLTDHVFGADQRHQTVGMEGVLEELFYEMEEEGSKETLVYSYKDYKKNLYIATVVDRIYIWMKSTKCNCFTYDW